MLNPDGLGRVELEAVLDRAHVTHRCSLVVIACNPVHHRDHLLWAVSRGISVLCDKPLLVTEGAAYDPAAAERIIDGYTELGRALIRAPAAGPCHLAMPLHRRANDVYRCIASAITEVQRVHGQGHHLDAADQEPRSLPVPGDLGGTQGGQGGAGP